jgi:hypothetical protein
MPTPGESTTCIGSGHLGHSCRRGQFLVVLSKMHGWGPERLGIVGTDMVETYSRCLMASFDCFSSRSPNTSAALANNSIGPWRETWKNERG